MGHAVWVYNEKGGEVIDSDDLERYLYHGWQRRPVEFETVAKTLKYKSEYPQPPPPPKEVPPPIPRMVIFRRKVKKFLEFNWFKEALKKMESWRPYKHL